MVDRCRYRLRVLLSLCAGWVALNPVWAAEGA